MIMASEDNRKPLAVLSRLPMPQRYKRPRSLSPDKNTEENAVTFKRSRVNGPASKGERSSGGSVSRSSSNVANVTANSTFNRSISATKMTNVTRTAASARQIKPPTTGVRRAGEVVGGKMKSGVAAKNSAGPNRPALSRSASATLGASKLSKNSSTGSLKKAGSTNTANSASAGKKEGGKKRPAWDLKGRVEDLEGLLKRREASGQELQGQLGDYNQRVQLLETQKQSLNADLLKHSQQAQLASQRNEQLQAQLSACQAELESDRRRLQTEIDNLNFTNSSLQRQKSALEGELSAAGTQITGLKTSVSQLTSAHAGVNAELEAVKLRLEQALNDVSKRDLIITQLKDTLAARDATIQENEKAIREHETTRRKLHNTIQELKGNIRVFCRVRPLLGEEQLGTDGVIQHIAFPDTDNKIIELDRMTDMSMNESTLHALRRGNNKYEFAFDRVFSPEDGQDAVFEEISQLVQSALDGYNVCIFAYGQTGSGKTYTMEGDLNREETVGMIPRTVQQIFQSARELEDKGWKYEFTASFVEIYNECIGDLLHSNKGCRDKPVKHEIRMAGKTNQVTVTNLTQVTVTDQMQTARLLREASENRAVASTKCNERSSRSHSVFILRLQGSNSVTGETCLGTLNLVDLAGSERLKDSGSEGQRLKETQAINRSLSHLGNVIMALGNKEQHIPYRDSKLTSLLQNSLGGNSKTLMFVNVSPKEECFSETLNSLRFAVKVNQCNIGTAQKRQR